MALKQKVVICNYWVSPNLVYYWHVDSGHA